MPLPGQRSSVLRDVAFARGSTKCRAPRSSVRRPRRRGRPEPRPVRSRRAGLIEEPDREQKERNREGDRVRGLVRDPDQPRVREVRQRDRTAAASDKWRRASRYAGIAPSAQAAICAATSVRGVGAMTQRGVRNASKGSTWAASRGACSPVPSVISRKRPSDVLQSTGHVPRSKRCSWKSSYRQRATAKTTANQASAAAETMRSAPASRAEVVSLDRARGQRAAGTAACSPSIHTIVLSPTPASTTSGHSSRQNSTYGGLRPSLRGDPLGGRAVAPRYENAHVQRPRRRKHDPWATCAQDASSPGSSSQSRQRPCRGSAHSFRRRRFVRAETSSKSSVFRRTTRDCGSSGSRPARRVRHHVCGATISATGFPTTSATTKCGLPLASSYTRPRYSPMSPRNSSWTPAKNVIATMRAAKPSGVLPRNSRWKIV